MSVEIEVYVPVDHDGDVLVHFVNYKTTHLRKEVVAIFGNDSDLKSWSDFRKKGWKIEKAKLVIEKD